MKPFNKPALNHELQFIKYILCCVFSSASFLSPIAAHASSDDTINIVVIGDSYAAGNGAGQYFGPADCYQSSRNWGSQYSNFLKSQGHEVNIVNRACSDGIINDYRNPRKMETQIKNINLPENTSEEDVKKYALDNICVTSYGSQEYYTASYVGYMNNGLPEIMNSGFHQVKCTRHLRAQINALGPDTDLVLMTGGGNDLEFPDIMTACYGIPILGDTLGDTLIKFIKNKLIRKGINLTYDLTASLACGMSLDNAMSILGTTIIEDQLFYTFKAIREKTNGNAKIVFVGYPYLALDDSYQVFGYAASMVIRQAGQTLDSSQKHAVALANADAGEKYVSFVRIKDLFSGHEPYFGDKNLNPDRWIYGIDLNLIRETYPDAIPPDGIEIRSILKEAFHYNPSGHAELANYLANIGVFDANKSDFSSPDLSDLIKIKVDSLESYYAYLAEEARIKYQLQSRLEQIKRLKEQVKRNTIIIDWVAKITDTPELAIDLLKAAIKLAQSISNNYVSEVEKAGRDLADAYAARIRAEQDVASAKAALDSAKNKVDQLSSAVKTATENYEALDAAADKAEAYAAYLGTLPVVDPNFQKQLELAKSDAAAKRNAANIANYALGQAKLSLASAKSAYDQKKQIYSAANTALAAANATVAKYETNLMLAQNGYAYSEIDVVIEILQEELAKQLDTTGGMIAYYQEAAGYKQATLEEKIQAELGLTESKKIEQDLIQQKDNASIAVYAAYREIQRVNALISEANIPELAPTVVDNPPAAPGSYPEPEFTIDPDNGLPNFDGPAIVAGARGVLTNKVKYTADGARSVSMSTLISQGTDASGLAYYAYKQSGITLENQEHYDPTGTNGIIHLFDVTSEESGAVPGDLIFYGFKRGEKPSAMGSWVYDWTNPDTGVEYDVETVGVYTGNGKLIDLQQSAGVAMERSINFTGVERLGFFHIKSAHANDPVAQAAKAKAEEQAALAAAIAAANNSAAIAASMAATAAQHAQAATAAVNRVNAMVLVTDDALAFVDRVRVAQTDAHQAAEQAEIASGDAAFAASIANIATTSGMAAAAASNAKTAETSATNAATNAEIAKMIAEGLADEAENINELARTAIAVANVTKDANASVALASAAAQAAAAQADAARTAADAASARAAVITAGEGDNAATANALAETAQQAAGNAEAAKQLAITAASEAAEITATIAAMTTVAEAQQALDMVNAKLAIANQAITTAADARATAENAKSQNDAFKAYRILSIGSSGTWWGTNHWRRLGQAIGLSISSDSFGRSPAFEQNGAYSSRAKSFQNYLNANDGGKTSNITADGYWGPQTTEKLRAVMDYRCGTHLGVYGSIDGIGSGGGYFVFNQDEASALAACLNADRF